MRPRSRAPSRRSSRYPLAGTTRSAASSRTSSSRRSWRSTSSERIDEENPSDARGLARDLRDITADAQGLTEGLPEWDDAEDVTAELTALLDLYGRTAAEYLAYFNEETGTLRRARNLRRQIGRATPGANESFAELETLGIACDDQPLVIEEF